jgi:hypothetical protein
MDRDWEREQEDEAAREAREIGGRPYSGDPGEDGDPIEYAELDDRPAGQTAESWRPVEEGGGGEAEGFEEAEAELIERAENPHGPSPFADATFADEEGVDIAEYGEADEIHTSEDEPGEGDW